MAQKPTMGTPVLRRINTAAVLDAVRRSAPAPQRLTELVELTGLTRPTVAQAVGQLLESGWLLEHPPATSEPVGGRPATRVGLNARAAPVLGLDIGPHTVTAGVADLNGDPLAVVRRKAPHPDARHVLAQADQAMADALATARTGASDIAAVVVATPGIVDARTGRVVYAPSLPEWTSIDLAAHLKGTFACPVAIENDANLAALADARTYSGKGTVLAVRWGERLGAGVIIDGRLHRGAGASGEIGFIPLPGKSVRHPDERPAKAEKNPRRSLEEEIGAEGIVRLAREYAAAHPRSKLHRAVGAADVFQAAEEGDTAAGAVVEYVIATLAQALGPALLVLCPDVVVVSGGVARAGGVLAEALKRHLVGMTLVPPRIDLSTSAENATLTGAFRMALDDVWVRRLSP
ncbi:ROK family protein [Streptomyces sp. NPDC001698]|uniref:ROK family transcriptional regulator n=1 Tax=unclassified Streptomyces TaxID=2593676 RepID=UPI0036973E9E